ncbi:MAG TPA: YIP1 family protein [bacterium]|nr:YIP1 family protein [bacterium]
MSPWITAWVQPRATIRAVLKLKHQYGMVWLGLIFGIHVLFGRAEMGEYGKDFPLLIILAGVLVLAIPFGLVAILIQGSLLSFIGRWFGGKATQDEARAAVAWSCLPLLISNIFILMTIAVMGQAYFMAHDPATMGPVNSLAFGIGYMGTLIGFIWAFVLEIVALAEVHRFNLWKSTASVLILYFFLFLVPSLLAHFLAPR